MDDDAQEQTEGIYQHMPFASVDLLAAIVAMRAALLGRSDRLAVNNRCAGGRFPPGPRAYPLPLPGMNAFPSAVQTPSAEVMIDRLVAWDLMGQEPPGTAAAQQIKDPIQDAAEIDRAWAPARFGWWEQWSQHRPFLVGEIGRVSIGNHERNHS
jgi:hypothetical protein